MRATGREWLIGILRFGMTRDAHNNPIDGWSLLAEVYAEKTDVSDSERLRAAQLSATITTRFRLLWSEQIKDVNAKDRITCDGREYEIVGAKEIGRREGIEITAAASSDLFKPAPAPEPGP